MIFSNVNLELGPQLKVGTPSRKPRIIHLFYLVSKSYTLIFNTFKMNKILIHYLFII